MYSSEISLLCVICDRNKRYKTVNVLENQKNLFNLEGIGKGTANSKILNYLGLGETEKSVFFSILPKDTAYQATEKLDEILMLSKPGHGISFLTAISKGCYHKPVAYTSNENGDLPMEKDTEHNLIIVILNRGYSEEVMEAALEAGATGGTLLNARGCGIAGMEKFFGVTITPEKEMIMIVAADALSDAIMNGIAEKAGLTTEADAVSFSIPVNHVVGLGKGHVKPGQ